MIMKEWIKVIGLILIANAAGGLGAFFTADSVNGWYAVIEKPALTPPGWLFGPVWTALYTMMGIACYLVLRKGWNSPGVKPAIFAFALQLALNAAWSPIFFGIPNFGLALIVIIVMWLAIALTIYLFRVLDHRAAWLLVPYLLWVTFATYLNYSFWILAK